MTGAPFPDAMAEALVDLNTWCLVLLMRHGPASITAEEEAAAGAYRVDADRNGGVTTLTAERREG